MSEAIRNRNADWVYVNGQRLSDAQVANLARWNSNIPDGAYEEEANK